MAPTPILGPPPGADLSVSAARLKLPGMLLLGKSALAAFDAAFTPGTKPAPLPTGATDARQFLFAGSWLTLSTTSTAPGIATTALLETAP